MVPAIIYLIYKHIRGKKWSWDWRKLLFKARGRKQKITTVFVALFIFISCTLSGQEKTLTYKVIRNGKESGWVKLTKSANGNNFFIRMCSEIRVRMLLLFTVVATEYTEFQNGTMIYSSVFRKMNDTVKENKQTRLCDNHYEIKKLNVKENVNIMPIAFNILCLYFQEPDTITRVYSDTKQEYGEIEKMPDGGYKVSFPDGDNNKYYYSNGVCTKVVINHSFYSAEFILTK
jgi:hypothetical protein